jgi:glyoxylase-like metal-dependent hydrolase (beta-lactamase superfamily II)
MTRRAWAILWAATAASAALALGALQSVAWHGSEAPALARGLTAALDPGLLLEPASSSLAAPSESYFGYGRLTIAIYVLIGAAATALRSRWPRRGAIALALLGVTAGMGDVAAYWASEWLGPDVRRIGFWYTEVPALALAIAVLTGWGASGIRHDPSRRCLALCAPLVLATTAALGYLPHGPLLGLALTLLLVALVGAGDRATASEAAPPRRPWQKAAIALAVASAVVLLALLYRPVLEPGPRVPPAPTPVAERIEGARLHVFNTGYNRMSWWLVGRERPWRPVPAFVVEQPESGLFAFDTGFSDAVGRSGEAGLHVPERWVIESRSHERMLLPAQMRAAGLDPEAVHHVVVSHLHEDHVGQVAAFPNALFLGGPGSGSFATGALATRWRELRFDTGARLGPFDDVIDFAGDGSIVLIRGGGHTSEGLMLLLALDQGPVLLAGDAAVHSDWLRSNDVQRIASHPERAARVRNQIRTFLDTVPDASIAYGHDLRGIDCSRRDIVCHAGVTGEIEGLETEGIEARVAAFVRRAGG